MSLLNDMLKIAGTIVEGAGKTLVDCVNVIEQERKEYMMSDEYKANKAYREEKIQEIKDNWNVFNEGNKRVIKEYKEYKKNQK